MSTYAYDKLLNQVQQLTPDQQFQFLADMLEFMRRQQPTPKPLHRISELKGLGKEIWEDIDVDLYIKQERASWDG